MVQCSQGDVVPWPSPAMHEHGRDAPWQEIFAHHEEFRDG
jgi:hypothetical protein